MLSTGLLLGGKGAGGTETGTEEEEYKWVKSGGGKGEKIRKSRERNCPKSPDPAAVIGGWVLGILLRAELVAAFTQQKGETRKAVDSLDVFFCKLERKEQSGERGGEHGTSQVSGGGGQCRFLLEESNVAQWPAASLYSSKRGNRRRRKTSLSLNGASVFGFGRAQLSEGVKNRVSNEVTLNFFSKESGRNKRT